MADRRPGGRPVDQGAVVALPVPSRPEARWAELHAHSSFSFLQGASSPPELVAEAARLGIDTLAVTDRDGLYGARRLSEAAAAAGLATVHGAELTLDPGAHHPTRDTDHPTRDTHHPTHDTDDPARGPGAEDAAGLGTPVVLARDLEGFRRLSAAISAAQLAGAKGAPRYDLAALADAARGGHWAVLTGCPPLGTDARHGAADPARQLARLAEVFGADHVHAELVDRRMPGDSIRNDAVARAAARAGMPVVATGAVHYAAPRHARLAQALAALRRGQELHDAAGHLPPAPTAHLRSPGEMRRALGRRPGVLEATLALGDACALDLGALRPELPGFPAPTGHDEDSWLRHRAETACAERYGRRGDPAARAAWQRLDHELAVITELRMSGYFLIVDDIVGFAREAGIWCQGRGSAASSVICFVLGITAVDPVRHGLLFARFLSTEKAGPPDIDLDFEHARREEVIQYVYRRYGRTHAAQVANVITYRPRLAVRDAARALGHPPDRIEEMTRHIHHHEPPPADAPVPGDVRALAAELHRLPRHLGVHSGGMVLTRGPVGEIMPVEWATAEGRSVLQGDKDDVEAAGLVKIDLLGLGMLSALHTACDLIDRHHGRRLDLASIPPEDPAVYEMLGRADTVGVFQVESRAQMSTLPRLRPRNFNDLVVAVSLIRPGPIQGGSVHPYLRRRSGAEPVRYPHPLAEPALRRSLGIALWQEQAMRLAIDCAGFSAGQADRLRKALAAKHSAERVAELRSALLTGMARRGIDRAAAEEITGMIEAFSHYGFPESHAQSMAHLVYASAWIKRHYPGALLAAIMSHLPMGFYSQLTLVGDARRRGVAVRGVDVHASGVVTTLESGPGTPGGPDGPPAIRLGLATVRGLGAEQAERVVAARPFSGVDDLAARTRLPARVLENLATAGALDCLGSGRREAIWHAGAVAHRGQDPLPGTTAPPPAPDLPEMTATERTYADLWATGASAGPHPVEYLRDHLTTRGAATAAEVRVLADRSPVLLGGLVTHRQRPPTAKGTCFLNIEDESGMTNVIVSPPVWQRYQRIALDHPGLVVHGTVERDRGAVNVVAHRIEPLRLDTPARRTSPRTDPPHRIGPHAVAREPRPGRGGG